MFSSQYLSSQYQDIEDTNEQNEQFYDQSLDKHNLQKNKLNTLDINIQELQNVLDRLKHQGKVLQDQLDNLKKNINSINPIIIEKYQEQQLDNQNIKMKDEYQHKPMTKQQIDQKLDEKKKNRPQMPIEEEEKQIKIIQKEISNAQVQAIQYKADLARLQKLKQTYGEQNPIKIIKQIEDELSSKNLQIENAELEIKKLEKLKRDNEKLINFENGGSTLADNINELQKENDILLIRIDHLEKNMLEKEEADKKRDQLINKIKEKCSQLNIQLKKDYSVQLPLIEHSKQSKSLPHSINLDKSMINLSKNFTNNFDLQSQRNLPSTQRLTIKEIIQEKDNFDKLEKNQSNYNNLKEQVLSIIRINQNMKRNHEIKKQSYIQKINQVQDNTKLLQKKVLEKEKEIQLIEFQLTELNKLKPKRQLNPISETYSQISHQADGGSLDSSTFDVVEEFQNYCQNNQIEMVSQIKRVFKQIKTKRRNQF